MKKLLALALVCSFKLLPGQNQDDRFTMRIMEPKNNKTSSIGAIMLEDPRITSLFKVEVVRNKKIEEPVIQIIAPDGFKMGTCFLTCSDASMLNFELYKEIERRTRAQWENMKTLESYKKFCNNQKG